MQEYLEEKNSSLEKTISSLTKTVNSLEKTIMSLEKTIISLEKKVWNQEEKKNYGSRDSGLSRTGFQKKDSTYRKSDDFKSSSFEKKSFWSRDFGSSRPSFPKKDSSYRKSEDHNEGEYRSNSYAPKRDKVNSNRREGTLGYERRWQRSTTRKPSSSRWGSSYSKRK